MSETLFDYSGDQVADAVEITGGPGDGFIHATGIDADQNGVYETFHVDVDGDLMAEVTAFDIDQNGIIDMAQVDENGNQVADAYLYDNTGDGQLDVRVNDANENGIEDSSEIAPALPTATTPSIPTPAEIPSLVATNPTSLIGLYEQVLNTPVDPADEEAVANKAKVLSMIAEMVASQQASTSKIIDMM